MPRARLSAAEAIAALARLGFGDLKPATLWQWKHRGHLSPGRGYSPDEIAAYLHRRATHTSREKLTSQVT